MISSDTKILLRRSGVPGRVPTTADLKLGELGVNYYDGKIFLRQQNEDGDRIIEPGQAYDVGKTIFVTVNGNDNNEGLNERDAKRTIKAAAAIAEPGDSIKVYPGQYIEDNPIIFRDRVSVEGMELRNVLVTPANPGEDLYLVGDGFHATNHSFVSNQDSTDGAAIISFRRLEGTASDRYFDAARLIRDNLDFIASETVGFLTSGFSGFAAGHRSQDGARSIELNSKFISEEAFQFINSPDYDGPSYVNPNINQCRSDLRNILDGWRYDLISDGNSETTGVGLTYYAPIQFFNSANITDLVYDNNSGLVVIETDINTQVQPGDEIKLQDIRLDCASYGNDFLISGFRYDNVTGVGTVSLPFIHDIQAGQTIKLDGLEFDCPPYGASSNDIVNFVYDETNGSSRITLATPHGLEAGDDIELRGILFDCPPYGGRFSNITDLDYNNVSGRGVITFEDSVDLTAGDTVTLFDITLSCPAYGNAISVTDFDYDNFTGQAEVEVASAHGLVPGSRIKLEDLKFSCNSYLNETFGVVNFAYNNLTGEAVATLSEAHSLSTGESVRLDGLVFECNSYLPQAKGVADFQYTNTTGISTILLHDEHGLSVGDTFRLEDLVFACNSYSFTTIDVVAADYQEVTGFVTLTLDQAHGQEVGSTVRLADLEFSCPGGSGITTTLFPDGTYGYDFEILDVPSANQMILNVGESTIEHSYVSGGTCTVGITTTAFPDGTQGYAFTVVDTPDNVTVVTNVGVSTIAHTYVSGGNLFVGFTTTVFPDGTQGDTFQITSIPSSTQIGLSVGISSIAHSYVEGGTVETLDSFIAISDLQYNNVDGTGLVTLNADHGLTVGDSFIMEDVTFNCDSYRNTATRIDILGVDYINTTGEATIILAQPHGLIAGESVALYDLDFDCVNGTSTYPDGSAPNFYTVLATPDPSTVIVNVGVSTLAHTHVVNTGELQVGITTNVFPDGTRPSDNFFNVVSVPAPNQVITEIGISSIAHTYASGGKFYTGITTNIFPQTFEDPTVNVSNAVYAETTGLLSIETDKPHGLTNGAPVLLQFLEWDCPPGGGSPGGIQNFPRNNEVYNVLSVLSPTTYTVQLATSTVPHTYVQGGTSTPQNILDAVYDNGAGLLTVTTALQHGYKVGDKASVTNLLFSCQSGGPNNAPGQLIFPRQNDRFVVDNVAGATFTTNVGAFPGLIHSYVNGGSVKFGGSSLPINSALYNDGTGELTVTLSAPPAFVPGDTIVMQGLNFSCNSGGPGNDPGNIIFPRLDVPYFTVTSVVNKNTYVISVGTSGIRHTYVSGGFSTLKKRANDKNIFDVIGVLSPTRVLTNVGQSDIAHDYVSGGNLFVGITTNVFPDGTRPQGSRFEVLSTLSPNQAVINIGVSTIPHIYESGGRVQYGDTNERVIIACDYNNVTGLGEITVRGNHNLTVGSNVKLENLEFSCTNSPGITTTIFPDGTAPSYNIFEVTEVINANTFVTNIGKVAFAHDYISGGSAFVGVTTNFFPDGTQGYQYTVADVISPTEVSVNVGVSSIQHNYIRGGQLFAGRTNERDILDFDYDYISGSAVLTLRQPEELFTGDLVKLQGLEFDCPNSSGITTNIFPDGSQGFLFPITQRLNSTQFQLEVGASPFEHNYVRGTGQVFVGITTNIFPDVGPAAGQQPSKLFTVIDIPAPNQVTAQIGVSTIQHNYVGGGKLSVGINTDIFPGGPEVSPKGDVYTVEGVTEGGELVIDVGPSRIQHFYANGGQVLYGLSAGGQLQHITGPGVKEATVAAIDFERQMAEYAVNNRPWGSFIVGETSVIEMIEYDNTTGFATVTAPGINAFRGDTIRMADIQFRCSDEYAGLTTTFFPDNSRPQGQYFTVDSRVGIDTFECFIGISTIRHEYSRGGNAYRYRQNILNVDYDRASGIASVRSFGHGFKANDLIELGDIRFSCPVFTPDYDVENFQYDNASGLSTVTTTVDNDIQIGDLVRLDGIQFQCPPVGNGVGIQSFFYDNTSGFSTVYTSEPHGLILNPRTPVGVVTASYDSVSGILTVITDADINLDNNSKNGVQLDGLQFEYDDAGVPTVIEYPVDSDLIFTIAGVESLREFSANVGVSAIPLTFLGGGTATKVDRDDIRLANLKFDCPPYGNDIAVTNFQYDNTSGNSLITVAGAHNLSVGENIKLQDIKFQCLPYNNDFRVIDANYNTTTGSLIVSVDKNFESLTIGSKVRIQDLQFDCDTSGVPLSFESPGWDPNSKILTVNIPQGQPAPQAGDLLRLDDLRVNSGGVEFQYPDGRDESYNIYQVVVASTPNFQPGVGPTWEFGVLLPNLTEQNAIFVTNPSGNYGSIRAGITTNIYPENAPAEGIVYEVESIPASNQFQINVGINTIPHTYIRGGQAFVGVTTNVFPDPDPRNSPRGNIFPVVDIPAPNQLRINVGTSTITHVYESGGLMLVGITTNIFPDGTQGDLFPVISIGSSTEFRIAAGVSSIPHTYQGGGKLFTGITTNIFPSTDPRNSPGGSIYEVIGKDEMCPDRFEINVGTSDIIHNYVDGGTVTTGVTTDRFPDGTNGFKFPVLGVLDEDNFTVNVGVSSIDHSYLSGGFTRRVDSPVQSFSYDNTTGIATVGVTSHRLNIGDLVKVRDVKFDCDPYGNEKFITDMVYNNATGRANVITTQPHQLAVNDTVKLSGIQMDCDAYNNTIGIQTAIYNNTTGVMFIQTVQPHGFGQGDNTKIDGLEFNCTTGTSVYPDGSGASINIYEVLAPITANSFNINVGTSTITHFYNGGGNVFVGITTNIFPGSPQNSPKGSFLRVIDTPSASEFTVDVGISSINHRYVRGGIVQAGITTDVFPDGTQGDFFVVKDVLDENTFEVNTGISSIVHRYNSGGYVAKYSTYQSRFPQVLDDSLIRVGGDCPAVVARVDQLADIVTTIINEGPEAAPGGARVNVTGASYNNTNGDLSITVDSSVSLEANDIVEIENLIFSCESSGVLDTKIFPDNKILLYPVQSVLSSNTFIINVGASDLVHNYVSGGTVALGIRYEVVDAQYNNVTGVLEVETAEPNRFVKNTGVKLNNLQFSCASGTKSYPEGTPALVVDSTYDNLTGVLRVTTNKPHQVYRDAKVKLEGLQYTCDQGTATYPTNPNMLQRVTGVEDAFTYTVQLETSTRAHTYLQGGTSDPGKGNFRVAEILSATKFTVEMAGAQDVHTYVGGGSAASVFAQQELQGINLRTAKCADDVKKIYLAVAHDISRGGNWKSVEAGKRYYDALGQVQFIAGGEIDQTVQALDFSINIARCVINNVPWGYVSRGYLRNFEQRGLALPKSTKTSVMSFQQPLEVGQFSTNQKSVSNFDYDATTGIASVTTTLFHGLKEGDAIKLSDLQFRCPNSPRITTDIFPDGTQGEVFHVRSIIQDKPVESVNNAIYDNETGVMTIETLVPSDVPVGSTIKVRNLRFACESGNKTYPTNPDYVYEVLSRPSANELVINAGIATQTHVYTPISNPIVGAPMPEIQELPNKFTTHVGTVGFDHIYVGGGTVWMSSAFSKPTTVTQVRDVSIQNDPDQLTNISPSACQNVMFAIDNAVGVVTTIIREGFEASGISTRYPGNDGKGVDTMDEMSSQGVGNIIKGPYIRNCTNFVPKSIGMRMDGFDAEPGDEISNGVQGSSNVDSFTQFNPGGIGCSISNGTYQQLVSIFTICCDEAIVCDSGAQLDLTNSNSSFGRLGLVARGIGDSRSKCVDRYTGFVAEEALIEDDTVVIAGLGEKRPYDGQGIYFGELYREVVRIEMTDGGSGYDDSNPPRAFVAEPTGPSGIKAEVSPNVVDGVVVSIDVIANGNQYREVNPVVTIEPPKDEDGRQARAIAITEPLYYDVDSATEPVEGVSTVVFKQLLNNTVSVGTTVYFSRLSLQIASSHSFEYIGAGNEIDGARPSQGGVPIKENEVVKEDGGQIVYTSTDQAGNFNIGDDLVINQFTGTVTGRSFDQSVLNRVTPLIIALDS